MDPQCRDVLSVTACSQESYATIRRKMIRSRKGWRKLSIAAWTAVSIPFVILGFKAGLIFGVGAILIGIVGLTATNRAFRTRQH